MKKEDLMISDWVSITEPDDFHGYIGKVVIINAETNYIMVHIPNMHLHDVFVEDLQPIPLTAEILEKNGWKYEFDKKKYMVRYDLGKEGKDCWMMWSIDEKTLDLQRQDSDLRDIYNLCVQRVVIPCNYVHELQHALKLCGIEKEIVL